MDLDDSFLERVSQRSGARKEFLKQRKEETLSIGKKRGVLTDERQVNSDEPPSKSPKRLSALTHQGPSGKENDEMEDDADVYVPIRSASRGLAALRKNISNDEDDSTGFKPSHEHVSSETKTYMFSTNTKELCTGRNSRMANLAANIRQWENEVAIPPFPIKSVAPSDNATNPAPQTTFSMKLIYAEKRSNSKEILNNPAPALMHTKNETSSLTIKKKDCVDPKNTSKKMVDWTAAVAATLDTSSPAVPSLKSEDIKNVGFLKNCPAPSEESRGSEESMDENDFAENYNIMSNHRGDLKKELDYSPFKHTKVDQKKMEDKKKAEPLKLQAIENQIKMEPPKIETCTKRMAEVDPAELPLAARRALFEKNLLNGAPKVNEDVCFSMSIAQRAAMFENAARMNCNQKNKGPVVPKCDKNIDTHNIVQAAVKVKSENVNVISPIKKNLPPHTSASSPTKRVGNHVFLVQQKLLADKLANNLQDKEAAEEENEVFSMESHSEDCDSEEELEDSMGKSATENDHLEKLSPTPMENYSEESNLEKLSSSSEKNCSRLDYSGKSSSSSVESNCSRVSHMENLRTSCLKNDSEVSSYSKTISPPSVLNNSEMDYLKKSSSSSEGRNCSEISHPKKSSSSMEDSSYVVDNLKKLSSLSSVEDSCFGGSSHCRQSCTSDSSVESSSATSANGEGESENKRDSSSETPLWYTVSFYRKQKQENRLTPVQKICREKEQSTPELPSTKYTEIIQERIKGLQDEILRHQTVISQTSQALNLCSATLEFSGSTEQVEGERLLLVATQKRQACLNEIQRLKTFGAQGENIAEDKGTMTISDIILPLKREFVAFQVQGKDDDTVHYFLCLIRHGAQVIVTQMISTDDRTTDGNLVFTNHIQLQDLPPNFSVIFEVYALQTKKEVLPHEKKYHIKRESSKIRLTPKGKKNEMLLFPSVSSPGGPNAVRSPCFDVVGFTRFTLQNCNKSVFTLDKVPFKSPLEGVLRAKLQLHAEHKVMEKGFLTLFDDIGGYGAWLRRWCVLDSNNLLLWKYPDDEHTKEPAAIIDLKQCITGLVKPVARNICARPYTFQLMTMRPQKKGDQNSLVSRSVNTLTTTKHLLSADSKEERVVWCDKLNEALNNVRKWDPEAVRPVEGIQF